MAAVYSPNLKIEHLEPNSDQPEVPVNVAVDAVDAKITGIVTVGVGASNTATLTQSAQAAGSGVTDAEAFTSYYATADQVTDFGSVRASVTITAYQISALAGRGYGRTVTI